MNGLIDTLFGLDAKAPMFQRRETWISAGSIRAAAARASARIGAQGGDVFLHTRSAACLVAGILAAIAQKRSVLLPAHAQNAYLSEIGRTHAQWLDDEAIALDPDEECPRGAFCAGARDGLIGFFTSGSTDQPKRVDMRLSHLETQVAALNHLWGAKVGHVRGTVSHQHIYGLLFRVLWPVLSGRTADDEMALYWEDLQGALGKARTLVSSPAHLTRLPPGDTPFIDPPGEIFSSGQALPEAAARACARAFGKAPIEVLGSTETGGIAWRRQTTPACAWETLPGVRVTAASDGALEVSSKGCPQGGAIRTGDGVEILADGRFHLRPRIDRVEKIDGKRVSLARVEEMLASLPQIREIAAFALPARQHALAAIAVLTPEGQAQQALLGNFALGRALRVACAPLLEPAERPKHWRFLDAMPSDAQGKRVLSVLRGVFDLQNPIDFLEPRIIHHGAHAADITFRLAADLLYFRGHFPTNAILPGIAQIHIAILLARHLWRLELPSAEMARVKFRRILQPEDEIRLHLVHEVDKQRLRFSYHLGSIEASLGEIGVFS